VISPLPRDLFDPACPSNATPFQIGDKWAGMVLVCLEDGPRRFSELRVPLHRVSAKVLAETLRALERDGMITRTAYDEVPPRVEYALTTKGEALVPLIDDMRTYGTRWLLAEDAEPAAV
jgi:DNA-binding HxlR family transcriptional regulator